MNSRNTDTLHLTALVLLLVFAYAYFLPPSSPEKFGTNNSVRFYLTKSLTLDGSFTIEKYYRGGIDAALYNGHYYSGKAPAASFLAVPVFWLVWHVADDAIPEWLYLYLVQLVVISLPSVLLALLLHGFLVRIGAPCRVADLLVVGYSLGTMAFPYSTQFMGHQIAAVFLFGCFTSLLRWREYETASGRNGEPESRRAGDHRNSESPTRPTAPSPTRTFPPLLLAGLFAGLAVAADYQVALVVCILVLFTIFSFRRLGAVFLFALGCIPGVIFILLYNYASFGDPLSFPYAHEAMPIAREVQSKGLFGVKLPQLVPLLMLLFSPWRGLFFVSPFLLLSIPGLYCLATQPQESGDFCRGAGVSGKRLFWICGLAVAGYLLFNSSYTAWSGGSGYGPRFLVPILPFAVIPILAVMGSGSKRYYWLLVLLVLYSVAFQCVGTAGGPLAHEYIRNPVREFLLPYVLRGNVRPNWCTLAGFRAGPSMVLFAALLASGITLFIATGRRGSSGMARRAGMGEKLLWWLCLLGALAMGLLFIFHRTEETAYRYAVIGHSYDWSGDPEAAIPCFEKSLQMDPGNPLVLNDLTLILAERGSYERALAVNLRALAVRQGDPEIRARADLLSRIVDISNAIDAPPRRKELLRERAALLEKLGCPAAAQRDREEAERGEANTGAMTNSK
ncbi:MAG: hypothetical protein NTZ78_14380 [Candidatus Aureabacteria bacterium]|nr:hypothetical protein [Candidatus Auribacterota bacterium]